MTDDVVAIADRGEVETLAKVEIDLGKRPIALLAAVPQEATREDLDEAITELASVLEEEPNVSAPSVRVAAADGGPEQGVED